MLVPDGKIALGKLSQAIAHGATLLQVDGNFDDCLTLARKLAEAYPVELVNSVNPVRIQGQKTAAFEVVDTLGDAPDIHCLPVGNAGNITAYWLGYQEYLPTGEKPGPATRTPRMWGFQAAGSAPIVKGHPIDQPDTIATAIRIGNPASWQQAITARDDSGGLIDAVTDEQILAAHRILSAEEGVFVEPASAASAAGLIAMHEAGRLDPGQRVVCTVTGHGLKDPEWAIKGLRRRRRHAGPRAGRRDDRGRRARPRGLTWRAARPTRRGWSEGVAASGFPRPAPTSARGSTRSAWPSACTTWSRPRCSPKASRSRSTVRAPDTCRSTPSTSSYTLCTRRPRRSVWRPPPGLRLSAHNAIPHGRGLGSSAAAVVPGSASSTCWPRPSTARPATCCRWRPASRVTRTTSPLHCSAA